MSSIPKLEDILTAIFLLIPGFISFVIARKLASVETKFSDFEITVISIFLSLVNYVPFRLLINAENMEDIRRAILEDPLKLGQLIIITTVIGLTVGGLFKLIFRQSKSAGTLWNLILSRAGRLGRLDKKGVWVIVVTEKGEYAGQLVAFGQSKETEEREILIRKPALIKRGTSGASISSVEQLDEKTTYMLFTSQEIKEVIFYKELFPSPEGKKTLKTYLSKKIESFNDFLELEDKWVAIITIAIIVMVFFVVIFVIMTLAEGR
jgi:hypothetical protein